MRGLFFSIVRFFCGLTGDPLAVVGGAVAALVVSSFVSGSHAQTLAWETVAYGGNAKPTAVFGGDDGDGTLNKRALHVASNGDTVMVGSWFSGLNDDWLIVKHNASGALLWRAALNGQGNINDYAYAVARTAAGDYIVAGVTAHFANGTQRCTVAKYSGSTGDELWRAVPQPLNQPSTSVPYASTQCLSFSLDSDGNIYAVGRARVGTPSSTNAGDTDAYLVKLNSVGAVVWQRSYQGDYAGTVATPRDNSCVLVTTFSNSAIYVGLRLNSSTGVGDMDWSIRRLDASGNEIAATNVLGDVGSNDRPRAIAVSQDGTRLAVGGFFTTSGIVRGMVRLYDTANFAVPLAQPNFSSAGGESRISDVSFDGANNVYASGAAWLPTPAQMRTFAVKINGSGSVLWNNTFVDLVGPGRYTEGLAQAIDAAGNLYVVGLFDPTTPPSSTASIGGVSANYLIVRFDNSTGIVGDTLQLDGPGAARDRAHAVGIGESGNLYVAGLVTETTTDGGRRNFGLAKVSTSPTLAAAWTPALANPGATGLTLRLGSLDTLLAKKAMKVDANGNVYAASRGFNGNNSDIVVTKHSPAGTMLWRSVFDSSVNPGDNFTDFPYALALDSSGNAYVTGLAGGIENGQTTPYKAFVARYNTNTGVRDWTVLRSASNAAFNAYGYDLVQFDGVLYVVGETNAETNATGVTASSASQFLVMRVQIANGAVDWETNPTFPTALSHRALHVAVNTEVTPRIVYVGARVNLGTDNATNANFAMGVAKFSDAPSPQMPVWTRAIDNGAGADVPFDMLFERAGGAGGKVFLTGFRPISPSPETDVPLHIVSSLNSTTPVVTTVSVNGNNSASGASDLGYALASEGNGNIYLAGLINNNPGQEAALIMKFNNSGTELWRRTLNPQTGNNFDTAYAISVSPDGPVVTGQLFENTFFFGTIQLRGSDGEVMWVVAHDTPARDFGLAVQTVQSGVHAGRIYAGGWGGVNGEHQTFTLKAIDRASCTLKVDGRGSAPRATTDGLIILRAILGLEEPSVSSGSAPQNTVDVRDNLVSTLRLRGAYDVDVSGTTDFNDALLIVRYLLGFTGSAITAGLSLTGPRNVWEPASPTVPDINNSIRAYLQSCSGL